MSDSEPESLDFSAKDLMPDWVQEIGKPEPQKKQQRGGGGGRKFEERDDRGNNRRGGGGGGGGRGFGGGGGGGRDFRGGGGGRDDRRGGDRRGGDRRGGGGGRNFRGGGRDDRQREPREQIPQDVEVYIRPTQPAINALAKHIKSTARAFPLVDVAKMILGSRDRFEAVFQRKKPESGQGGVKPFYQCEADGSVWQTQEEAISHIINSEARDAYYTTEEISVDPPKGAFSVVAVCGMSGTILGPPNHHEYQSKVARLHAEQFSNMQIDRFKSRIEMSNDEETIEKWKTEVSVKKQFRVKPPQAPEPEPEPEVAGKPDETAGETTTPETEPQNAAAVGEDTAVEAPAESTNEEAAAETAANEPAEKPTSPEVIEQPVEAVADDSEVKSDEGEAAATEESSPESEAETAEETKSDAEAEAEVPSDEEAGPESPPAEETDAAPAPEEAEFEGEVIDSPEALERHFRENFVKEAISVRKKVVVPGEILSKSISLPLLNLMKRETENLRRGFPLLMIQELCRRFERTGLKFFKRGKKALHVSIARPRAIAENLNLSERVMSIVNHIEANPRCKVLDLLAAVVPDYSPPKKGETIAEHKLSDQERNILADLRWLTMEGYLIEFPGTELVLGKQPQPPQKKTAKKKKASKKTASKKNAKPSTDKVEDTSGPVDEKEVEAETVTENAEPDSGNSEKTVVEEEPSPEAVEEPEAPEVPEAPEADTPAPEKEQ